MFFAFVEKMNLNYYVSLDNYNRDKIYTMNKSKIINLDGYSNIWSYAKVKNY